MTEQEIEKLTGIVSKQFDKAERLRMLSTERAPMDYNEKKKLHIQYEIAKAELIEANEEVRKFFASISGAGIK